MSRVVCILACVALLCGPRRGDAAEPVEPGPGILAELERADAELARLRREETRLAAEVERLEREMMRHRRREARWLAERDSLRAASAERLRGLSRLWRLRSAWAYLRADRPLGLVRRERYLRAALREDLRLLSALATAGEALRTEREEIARAKRRLGARRARLRVALARMEAQCSAKQALVEAAQRSPKARKALAQELRVATRHVDRTVARTARRSPPGGGRPGEISLPVSGPVLSRFGAPLLPRLKNAPLRKGIELGALPGTAVHAAAAGTVVYAGYVPGFGRTLILDHGQRLHSVYGQLAEISVHPGGRVSPGQVVGSVGSSGVATRAGLYFELREGGRAVDPLRKVGARAEPAGTR